MTSASSRTSFAAEYFTRSTCPGSTRPTVCHQRGLCRRSGCSASTTASQSLPTTTTSYAAPSPALVTSSQPSCAPSGGCKYRESVYSPSNVKYGRGRSSHLMKKVTPADTTAATGTTAAIAVHGKSASHLIHSDMDLIVGGTA